MNPHKIARVRWEAGQMLLPEHFRAQDQVLLAETLLTAELTGLPVSGIGALGLNPVQLAEGILALDSLTAIMPGGHLVQVPGNATVAPVSLKETGLSHLTLYLHLMHETCGAEGNPLYQKDSPALHRTVHLLRLSPEQALKGAISTLELAELGKDEQGRWKLSRERLPPLLRASPHPFLAELFDCLDKMLEQARGQLHTALGDSSVRADRLSNARRALCEVRRVQGLRADMRHGLHPSTYQLFEALRRLYLELCCYLECEPVEELPAYEHDKPGPGLWGWMKLLESSLRPVTSHRSHQPFECREGRFVLSPLPKEEQGRPAPDDFYLLVRRHERDKPRSMEGVKIASPQRLSMVRSQALKGLPFEHVAYPGFPHPFESDLDWYQLTTEGDEWQAALREDKVALPVTPPLEGAQLFLFWRRK